MFMSTIGRLLVAALITWVAATGSANAAVDDGASEPDSAADRSAAAAAEARRFLDANLRSSDLRLRVFAGRSMLPSSDLQSFSMVTPLDILVEQSRGSTDPLVLAMLLEPCVYAGRSTKTSCDALSIATRWTVADTQNQVAWLALSSTLKSLGDSAGSREAFERAALASSWHEYSNDVTRVVARSMPSSLSPRARFVVLNIALVNAGATLLPHAELQTLSVYCKDASLRAACNRILDTIDRDGSTLLSRNTALAIARRADVDAQTIATRALGLDALFGAQLDEQAWQQLADSHDYAKATGYFEQRAVFGEVPMLRKMLADSGTAESASAAKYGRHRIALRIDSEPKEK